MTISEKGFPLFNQEEFAKYNSLNFQDKTPLWKYWDEFVEKYLRKGHSEATVKNVREVLRFVIRNVGLMTIEECNDPRLLDDTLFKVKQERHFSNVTFNSYLKNLNTYFRWLHSMEYITENKLVKIKRSKEEINEQYTLSDMIVNHVLLGLQSRRQTRLERRRNLFFVNLLILTGARPCELLSLQVKDVQKNAQGNYVLHIHGRKQKGKARYYNIPSSVRDSYEVYMDYRSKFRSNEPWLFISSSKRTGWTEKGMRGLFRSLTKEVGFRVTAYSFRRYVATKLNSSGLPIQDIMNHLGHTRLTTTYRYIQRSGVLTSKGVDIMASRTKDMAVVGASE